jgi:hypothetical protein
MFTDETLSPSLAFVVSGLEIIAISFLMQPQPADQLQRQLPRST